MTDLPGFVGSCLDYVPKFKIVLWPSVPSFLRFNLDKDVTWFG